MEIEHEFQELGIPIGGGWSFGSINGKCTVEYDEAGDWWITEIEVELNKWVNGMWSRTMHRLEKTNKQQCDWFLLLCKAIEKTDRREIEEVIAEAMPLPYEPRSLVSAGRSM
jgi:hypothetical protein